MHGLVNGDRKVRHFVVPIQRPLQGSAQEVGPTHPSLPCVDESEDILYTYIDSICGSPICAYVFSASGAQFGHTTVDAMQVVSTKAGLSSNSILYRKYWM